ncbi:unnamed protein product [Prunus armeniaca]
MRGRDCPTGRAKFVNTNFLQQMRQEHVVEEPARICCAWWLFQSVGEECREFSAVSARAGEEAFWCLAVSARAGEGAFGALCSFGLCKRRSVLVLCAILARVGEGAFWCLVQFWLVQANERFG